MKQATKKTKKAVKKIGVSAKKLSQRANHKTTPMISAEANESTPKAVESTADLNLADR